MWVTASIALDRLGTKTYEAGAFQTLALPSVGLGAG